MGIVLIRDRNLPGAIEYLEKAAELKPKWLTPHSYLASAYFYVRNYEAAWREIGIIKKLGGKPSPQLIQALSQKMPDPQK